MSFFSKVFCLLACFVCTIVVFLHLLICFPHIKLFCLNQRFSLFSTDWLPCSLCFSRSLFIFSSLVSYKKTEAGRSFITRGLAMRFPLCVFPNLCIVQKYWSSCLFAKQKSLPHLITVFHNSSKIWKVRNFLVASLILGRILFIDGYWLQLPEQSSCYNLSGLALAKLYCF